MSTTANIQENVFLKASEFMQMLKDQGMVIGPRTVFEANLVDGIPLEQFRERILRKALISFSEISKAQVWGNITQKAVYMIAVKEVPANELVKISTRLIKIPRETVKAIAVARGIKI